MAEKMEEPRREPARITIDGTPYVLPSMDSMDMDEAMVLYRYSDLSFDQIFELEGVHPGVVAGLLHVAIQRSDPALREREVKEMVSKVNMMNILEQLAVLAENTPDPTKVAAQPPQPDSETSNDDQTSSGGEDSAESSDQPQVNLSLGSSGTLDSDTSATSDPVTSVP
jgi:hypothetical protein